MKNISKNIILIQFLFTIGFTSCNDDFLVRYPLDQVSSPEYFKSPDELKTYMNSFYNQYFLVAYPNFGADFDSDNQIWGSYVDPRLSGVRVVPASGNVGYSNVRNINYFFDNYQNVKEKYELKEYQQYLGEAYFFKSLIYFNLLQNYGDVLWLDKVLGTNSPELTSPRTPRNIVIDNILNSLDSAALYLTADKTKGQGRINKWIALLLQSRVALYEGTWEKYHINTPFGVTNANFNKYFEKAIEASQKIMTSGLYDIYSTNKPEVDYKTLFAMQDYSTSKEVMFWRQYNNAITRSDQAFMNDRNFRMETPSNHSISKELADAYLCKDGKPISVSPLFQGYNTLTEEAVDRDPRFYQTIAMPDDAWKIHLSGAIQNWSLVYGRLNTTADYTSPGGYLILKGYNPETKYHVQQYEETPGIIYRYAEILLNYAEAKAELGVLTQEDLDESINKLRKRVGMPDLNMNNITTDPNWDFPTLSPIINEIRRERRVELACEGYRWADIARWAAADKLIVGKRPKGFKASQITTNPFPIDENGFLDPFKNALPNGYAFDIERDYLSPLPSSELVLNPNLKQNPGWDK